MELLVCPVSGGRLVNQLAILSHLCQINYRPTVTMASSGGNVASYIASAANWQWAGIARVAEDLSRDLFVQPRSSITLLSGLLGFFEGNVYRPGVGVEQFLAKHFTPETITRDEIWTGTYNKTRGQSALFCNQSQSKTIMQLNTIDFNLIQACTPSYITDIPTIAQVCSASASIPTVVAPQNINGDYHVDGGLCGSSPFSLLYRAFDQIPELHITYINSVDLVGINRDRTVVNVLDNWRQTTEELVRSQTLIERTIAESSLRVGLRDHEQIEYTTFPCDYQHLLDARKLIKTTRRSLLEICPRANDSSLSPYEIDLLNFNGSDVVTKMNLAYDNCHCRLWYVKER